MERVLTITWLFKYVLLKELNVLEAARETTPPLTAFLPLEVKVQSIKVIELFTAFNTPPFESASLLEIVEKDTFAMLVSIWKTPPLIPAVFCENLQPVVCTNDATNRYPTPPYSVPATYVKLIKAGKMIYSTYVFLENGVSSVYISMILC